jgi:conjugal transfer pilus assembly protein TraW
MRQFLAIPLLFWGLSASPALSKDYGVRGKTFVVTEVDLLKGISLRLRAMQSSGEIDRLNAQFKERAIAKINRPAPVQGISPATIKRSFFYDPTMVFGGDVKDEKGRVIVRKGQSINPLDTLPFNQTYVFFDGDRPEEVKYVTTNFANDAQIKLIMVKGAPLEAMKRYRRKFYFDQTGYLTSKLGIRHTPAVMVREGKKLRIEEFPL